MKTRIAQHLIRLARRLDPNSCVDFRPLPTVPTDRKDEYLRVLYGLPPNANVSRFWENAPEELRHLGSKL